MSFLLTTAKVSINIGNCKLYARKSDDFIDKWIVIQSEIKKGQAASDLFGVANSCYLVSYAITFLVLQLCCNGKDTTIS